VPSLVTLACSAPEPHSASAAMCLAAGMSGRCADAWRVHLGNLQVLTERCAPIVWKLAPIPMTVHSRGTRERFHPK
jgi:hypothetical protein